MQKAYSTVLPEIYRGVVEDNEDPKSLGRCRVRVPGIHGENKGMTNLLPWAEPIVLSPTSKGRGSINLPDVGDWVWVLFEGARKEYPLYFGGFYSNNDGLSIEGSASNNKVTVYTEEGNAIVYDRKSKTYTANIEGNSVEISTSGINITGDTNISGNTSISGDLSVSGGISVGGELLVEKDATFKKNINVADTVYCGDLQIGSSASIGGFSVSTENLNVDDIQEAINLGLLDPGDFTINQAALSQIVEKLARGEKVQGIVTESGYCQKFIRTLFEKAGLSSIVPTGGSAISAFNNWGGAKQKSWSANMPYGSTVYWSGGSGGNGHVAVYIGKNANGEMQFMHNATGSVRIDTMKPGTDHIITGIKSESHQFAGWIPACGSPAE